MLVANRADGKTIRSIIFTAEDYALPLNRVALEAKLANTGIFCWQVVHISEIWKDFESKYVYEHKDLTVHALMLLARHRSSLLPHLQDGTFIVDFGNSFKDTDGPILKKLGADSVFTLNPATHHKFSTLDSHQNSHIKAVQRRSYLAGLSTMDTHIEMLKCSLNFKESTILEYWNKNYMLGYESFDTLTALEVKKNYYSNQGKWHEHLEASQQLYIDYTKKKDAESTYDSLSPYKRRISGLKQVVSQYWGAELSYTRIAKKAKIIDP